MSLKNLNASSKIHKQLLNKLRDKRIYKIYNKFENNLNLNNDFTVAVSGGPDSLALAFFSKIYSIKKSLKVKYFLVDHKLRKNSSVEALFVKNLLKDFSIDLDILKWNGKKPKNNIQSLARKKRYNILINQSKKHEINNILFGHHEDDVYENFFIRLLRGSGLKGIVSLDKMTLINNVNMNEQLNEVYNNINSEYNSCNIVN